MPIKLFRTLALLACLSLPCATRAESLAHVSADALRADLAFIRATIARVHPDPSFSVDRDALARAFDAVAANAPAEMTQDAAWRRLSLLNPVLADGHLFLGYADWRAEGSAHLAAGGGFFPFEVEVDEDGKVFIRAILGGDATELAGARVVAIDGIPAELVAAELLKRMHGDTPRFRAALLSRRWWLYRWKMSGAAAHYRLDLAHADRRWSIDVLASRRLPAVLRDDGDFTRQFGFTIKPGCGAVLRVRSFDPTFKDRFLSLTHAAFARMREEHVETLLIDVAGNGGGDDDLWLDGLMPYLATRPYRTGSSYLKRVLKADPVRGEAVGQVVVGDIETWRAPKTDNPLLFKGEAFVAIGAMSYSSTVLFANVMQDFGFASLVGTGHSARRTQSGGVQRFLLPNTGLALWVPRFILAPPNGAPRNVLLAPSEIKAPRCLVE